MYQAEAAGLVGITPRWTGPPTNFEFLAKFKKEGVDKALIIASWSQSKGYYCNEAMLKEIGLQGDVQTFKDKLTPYVMQSELWGRCTLYYWVQCVQGIDCRMAICVGSGQGRHTREL